MGLWDIFRNKRKARAKDRQQRNHSPSPLKPTMEGIRSQVENLQSHLGTITIALKKHDDQLADQERRLEGHREGLQRLEQKVEAVLTAPPTARRVFDPPGVPLSRLSSGPPAAEESTRRFGMDRFTEQQKRILAVFFQNKGMRMSYAEVARTLRKSAYTVKNQMNQIRQKADLFELSIGRQSRNLFKLKDDLRIEKYLNLSQPVERPVSMPEPDPSETGKAKPTVECTLVPPEV